MKWKKLGVIWKPDGSQAWAKTHATCPTPYWVDEDTLRLYVQCRDEHNVGRVGFVDVDPRNPKQIIRVSDSPVLDIGRPGTFDENGVFQTSIVELENGDLYMYYVGFELGTKIRYRLLTGLAVSKDKGLTFNRIKETPILERSHSERFVRGGPYVLKEENCFRLWYVAGNEWMLLNDKQAPVYELRYAESTDGIHWPDTGQTCLPLSKVDEHGFGRPYIIQWGEAYRMFYSIRNLSYRGEYRLGMAVSSDSYNWQRQDEEIGLDVSSDSWDSESVEFAAVVNSAGNTYLFYNGNNFGETGFGVALLEKD